MRVPLRTPNLRSVRDTPRFYAPPPTRVLRFANKAETTRYSGHFEVVALSGYLAQDEFHLHMAVSDGEGCTMGGHVMEGNRVYTAVVIAVQENRRLRYRRAFDPASGYQELVIDER